MQPCWCRRRTSRRSREPWISSCKTPACAPGCQPPPAAAPQSYPAGRTPPRVSWGCCGRSRRGIVPSERVRIGDVNSRDLREQNRLSWNAVAGAHESHRGDLAGFLRSGGSTLFPEELKLLGPLEGKTLAHL